MKKTKAARIAQYLTHPRQAVRYLKKKKYGAFDGSADIIALHDQKILYFAVPKVANSSLKTVMTSLFPEDIKNLAPDKNRPVSLFRDKSLSEQLLNKKVLVLKYQLKSYENYLKFAFVRNPWDRLVSCYSHKMKKAIDGDLSDYATQWSLEQKGLYKDDMSFHEFAEAICSISEKDANRHYRSQWTFLCDNQDKLAVDEIGKFENLNEDFSRIAQKAGLGKIELPHIFKSARKKNYREYYTPELIEKVRERYKKDIELFNYDF